MMFINYLTRIFWPICNMLFDEIPLSLHNVETEVPYFDAI